MRIESSVTSLSWIPSEAVGGMTKMPFETGMAHYDPPPPDVIEDIDALQRDGRFRFANRLSAWIDVEDGAIVDHGESRRGPPLLDAACNLGKKQVAFEAIALPDLHPDPEVGPTEVTFFQTAGGRTGVPAPRRVRRAPYVQFSAPLAWTTLALTLRADGTSSFALTGASSFPRHWVYGGDDKLALKSGMIDFSHWYRRAFGKHSPWGDQDSQALTTEVETALERQLSLDAHAGRCQAQGEDVQARYGHHRAGCRRGRHLSRARRRGAHRGRRGAAGGIRAGLDARGAGRARRRAADLDDPGRHGVQARRGLGRRHRPRRPGQQLSTGHRREDQSCIVELPSPSRARLGRRAMDDVDAVVIGSGPNGLVAAALLARAGWSVTVLERSAVAGGAVHSGELTVPGYVHDTYSAFYGLLHCSPVLAELGLDTRRVEWAHFSVARRRRGVARVGGGVSPRPAAHRGRTGPARRRRRAGVAGAGTGGGVRSARFFLDQMLGPVGAPGPGLAFARRARREGLFDTTQLLVGPLEVLCAERFSDPAARALLAAGASHADVPVDHPGSAPAAIILALAAQQLGMPVPVGGAGRLAAALARLRSPTPAGWSRTSRRGHARGGGAQPGHRGRDRRRRRRCAPAGPCWPTPGPGALFHRLVGDRPVAGALSGWVATVPLRDGRVQGRPRPRRARPVGGARARRSGGRAPHR